MRKIPTEVYSRVVGYLRPIANWNLAKKQEFKDRINYRVSEVKNAGKSVQNQWTALPTTG